MKILKKVLLVMLPVCLFCLTTSVEGGGVICKWNGPEYVFGNQKLVQFFMAIKGGRAVEVDELLEYATQEERTVLLETNTPFWGNALHLAALYAQIEIAELLIFEQGSMRKRAKYVMTPDADGYTVLHYVALFNSSVNAQDVIGEELQNASRVEDQIEMVNMFMKFVPEDQRRAFVRAKNNAGHTAYYIAKSSHQTELANLFKKILHA